MDKEEQKKKKDDNNIDLRKFVCTAYNKGKAKGGIIEVTNDKLMKAKKNEKVDLYVDLKDIKKIYISNRSELLCLNFEQAVLKDKYGWFWNCLNRDLYSYKHCLPQDYVFKSKDKNKVAKKTLEEILKEKM